MDNKYLLSSLENTLRLIDIMAAEQEIGITELSSRMNLGKSTIHRILNTLLKYDYVKQNEATGRYSLGFKIVNIANDILSKYDIITVTRPPIEALVDSLDENAVLFAYANRQVSIIEVYSCHHKRVYYYTGQIYPAYACGAGRAFISHFPPEQYEKFVSEISYDLITPFTVNSEASFRERIEKGRKLGYYICNQEIDEGVISFAAPIYSGRGTVDAVLSVYGAASEMTAKRQQITEKLLITASECTELAKKHLL